MKYLSTRCAEVVLVLFIILWLGAVSFAETGPSGYSSEWPIFLLLVGIIQALIGYIYVSGQRRQEGTNREFRESIDKKHDEFREAIKDLYNRKIDKEYHDDICPNPRERR